MGRNKKDATQDVLNLYNQMQEDENIESGKDEIKVTLEEIESAKKVLNDAKEELGKAYQRLVSTKVALMAAHRSTDNIVDGICNAIVKAEQSNLKVGINDEGLALLNERNNTAISAFKQALDEHEKRIKELFAHQQKELKRIRNIEEGAYFNGRTYAWMFGLAFVSWVIILVEITIWICIKLFLANSKHQNYDRQRIQQDKKSSCRCPQRFMYFSPFRIIISPFLMLPLFLPCRS